MNYTELQQEVQDFAHRTDLSSKMDTFVLLAESIINKELRVTEQETILPVSFDTTYFDLPTDFLEMRAMHIELAGARVPLKQLSPQQLDAQYSRATGKPRAYAMHGGQFEFRPGIDGGDPYPGEITYFAKVPSLIDNASTDVLTNYPMIYLAAMMIQVYIYVQDQEQLNVWLTAFSTEIAVANKTALAGRYVLPTITIGAA